MASLSQKKFAERVGVSRQRIGQLVSEGKLTTLPDKSIPMPQGLDEWKLHRPGVVAASAKEKPSPEQAAEFAETAQLGRELRRVQITQRSHAAALAEINLAKKRGDLVPREEVIAEARMIAAAVRERLSSIPSRLALLLEAAAAKEQGASRAAAIEALVADEINAALQEMHSSVFLAAALKQRAL